MPSPSGNGRRAEALSEAARQRNVREATLRDLQLGRSDLAGVLDRASSDPAVGAIKIVKLVEVVPGVGKVMARRTLAELALAEDLRAGELDATQRAGLLGAIVSGPGRA